MLLLMSVFVIFSADARYIMKNVGQQPPIELYMKLDGSEAERTAVTNYLSGDTQHVLFFQMASPEENYNEFKTNLGSSSSILDSFDYNQYLPYTFHIQLVDPSYADEVVMHLEALPGVNKVMQERQVMVFLTQATQWVNAGTAGAFCVLFLISLFIISNMVRISVYSRATEITIMKYIGATNAYIRLPYIIEGAIVGLVSAVCAWGIACLAYGRVYSLMMAKIDPGSFYSLLPVGSLSKGILLVCAFCGILIGAFGSGVSVRKYVKV
jgi:cell division transport system permease protein